MYNNERRRVGTRKIGNAEGFKYDDVHYEWQAPEDF
jgi:hypothetical protein